LPFCQEKNVFESFFGGRKRENVLMCFATVLEDGSLN